jgi:hypothetical protein
MALLARRPVNVATVALANKMARVIWVVLVRGQSIAPQPERRLARSTFSRQRLAKATLGRDGSTGRTGDRRNPNDAWDQNP